jgi:hypothetical protein
LSKKGLLLAAGLLLPVIAGFYIQQNWTGKRGWERYKTKLAAQGENLDWNAYVPAPIPDDQNIFAAPKMQQWFVKGESSDLNIPPYPPGQSIEIARVEVAVGDTNAQGYDLLLRYDAPVLSSLSGAAGTEFTNLPVFPLIRMEDVPLPEAVAKLAEMARLPQPVDTALFQGPNSSLAHSPVSINWSNVTGPQALKALLANYGLQLIPDKPGKRFRLAVENPAKPEIYFDSTTRDYVAAVVRRAVGALSKGGGRSLKSCLENTFISGTAESATPARILVRAENVPSCRDVERFFPPETIEAVFPGAKRAEVDALGSNSFSVYLPSVVSAHDYLDWSDQLEPKLSVIRSALERPFARMNGAYDVPFKIPIPNFIAVRQISQILAQRAQCHLLVNEPDNALQDLTLLHKLGGVLEGRPSGKPMTLVAAMINVAITGLYVETIGDGLRLHAWHEPQLIELQRQLAEVNLPPLVAEAFREERAGVCHTLETISPTKLNLLMSGKTSLSVWQKMREPRFWLLSQMPRGWVYENMITVASLDQRLLAGFGPGGIVQPRLVDEAMAIIQTSLSRFSPANFIAAQIVPNYLRATRTTAYNQTMANLALIACALERYRTMHNAYPASLEVLAPRFLGTVPRDVVKGAAIHYSLQDNGLYLLYSVGWNETDDHGRAAEVNGGFPKTLDEGDWVWRAEFAVN